MINYDNKIREILDQLHAVYDESDNGTTFGFTILGKDRAISALQQLIVEEKLETVKWIQQMSDDLRPQYLKELNKTLQAELSVRELE